MNGPLINPCKCGKRNIGPNDVFVIDGNVMHNSSKCGRFVGAVVHGNEHGNGLSFVHWDGQPPPLEVKVSLPLPETKS